MDRERVMRWKPQFIPTFIPQMYRTGGIGGIYPCSHRAPPDSTTTETYLPCKWNMAPDTSLYDIVDWSRSNTWALDTDTYIEPTITMSWNLPPYKRSKSYEPHTKRTREDLLEDLLNL